MNLFFIGYRGAGKSIVARLLAARLGRNWFDADEQIETVAGKSIAEIFASEGETGFRDREVATIARLAKLEDSIIALGGGAVLRPANRQVMKTGKTIWLTAQPETLWERISADAATAARRPNLTPHGGIAEITATLAARLPFYRECADLEIDTEGQSADEIAEEILRRLAL
jgi:shikimate kinase